MGGNKISIEPSDDRSQPERRTDRLEGQEINKGVKIGNEIAEQKARKKTDREAKAVLRRDADLAKKDPKQKEVVKPVTSFQALEIPDAMGASNDNHTLVDSSSCSSSSRRLGALEATDDLSVVHECLVGAFLLLLMFMVYLFTRRTTTKSFESNAIRIVRKKAPIVHKFI